MDLVNKNVRNVLLAHLSKENNFPELAVATIKNILDDRKIIVGKMWAWVWHIGTGSVVYISFNWCHQNYILVNNIKHVVIYMFVWGYII